MKVEVKDIDADRFRLDVAHEGVEVGSVHVEVRAVLVEQFGDLLDLFLIDPQGVGVRHHEGRDVTVEILFHRGRREVPLRTGGNLFDIVSGEVGRGGVGPVGGVGDQYDLPGVAVLLQPLPDQEHSGQLPMGPGGGDQCEVGKTGEGAQRLLQGFDNLQVPLDKPVGGVGVGEEHPTQGGDLLVDLRVVLHRTGAEGVKAFVQGVVQVGELGVVADDLHLRDLRKQGRLLPELLGGEVSRFGDVQRGKGVTDLSAPGAGKDERFDDFISIFSHWQPPAP